MPDGSRNRYRTATHWGAYTAEVENGRVVALEPFAADPDPSEIGQAMAPTLDDPVRIPRPMIRKGWLENGPRQGGNLRGGEPFVSVPWDEALEIAAGEIARIREAHGNAAIYGGSYGWGSAGRFHHAQSQIHRFLNMAGGYTRSVCAYSYAAAETLLPHIVGNLHWLLGRHTSWEAIAAEGELMVMFGGVPVRNTQVSSGGASRHNVRDGLKRCKEAGLEFVNVSLLRDDVPDFLEAEWLSPVPNTDTALILGLCHEIHAHGWHDAEFLARYTVGFETFLPYLTGTADGQPKDCDWAARICGVPAERLRTLAKQMAHSRTMISMTWSLQRGDHGEQPLWAALTLAAMLGQIGLPGGGIGYGYGSANSIGENRIRFVFGSVNQGENAIPDYIPVARVSDLLLHPGEPFDYDGHRLTYPDIRMVYWAGGNPFHHHQDLNRLLRAWQQPETIIVHEPWWNALARHADIVFPATTPLERNDIAYGRLDSDIIAMEQAVPPFGEARNDHDIFAGIARHLGFAEQFTEGRDETEWLEHLWNQSRQRAAQTGFELPSYEDFKAAGSVEMPRPETLPVMFDEFRTDPDRHPLWTKSGKIEIFCEEIASFGYDDCPGHAVWLEPEEWLGARKAKDFPLHLLSNQPRPRLHSQLDNGPVSRATKVAEREPIRLNPQDAEARGLKDGDVVRVFNDRGQCLAGLAISEDLPSGVAQLATGAWYDPVEPGVPGSLDKHGNANVLTLDKGTSKLGQAPSAHSCLVQVERFDGEVPPLTCFTPPEIVERGA